MYPSLGWQSWSPPTPSLLRLPLWDYPPTPPPPSFTPPANSLPPKPPISLWCSWHANGPHPSEALLLTQANRLASSPYRPEYLLIDDGWCSWGDWTTPHPSNFPTGIKGLVSTLRNLKYQTGLWLAPFLVAPNSNLAATHPEYLLRDDQGRFLNAFASYPLLQALTPKYLLDFRQPAVLTYLHSTFATLINDWGVSLLKLDHLYAPYFGTLPSNLASNALRSLLTHLHTTHPQVYTIACGAPFADTASCDAIRISKDINSPQLQKLCPPLDTLLYLKRRSLLRHKLTLALDNPALAHRIDPDAAINPRDAALYHQLWKTGKIAVFGLGYNL